MRQIERNMRAALRDGREWRQDNTAVTADGTVTLHGNRIAYGGKVDIDTLRRWPTVTTKSRLRALGFDIQQRAGAIYLDGEHVADC